MCSLIESSLYAYVVMKVTGSFRGMICITEEDGGMTDLARIMIRDCKYDVSTNSGVCFFVNLIQEKNQLLFL